MGNRASYNQVPVGDMSSPSLHAPTIPAKNNETTLPDYGGGSDLMFVFHDTEDDSAERVVHEQINNQRDIEQELKYTVTTNNKIICERRNHSEAADINSVCSILQPGDIVEFCADLHSHHWVVYTGNRQCVRLKHGKVTEEVITTLLPDRMARIATGVYRFKTLPSAQICSAAKSQIGKDSVWPNSECFAAWCRYGCPEFMSDNLQIKDLDSSKQSSEPTTETYKLEIYNEANVLEETKEFPCLVELIKYRRKLERDRDTE